MNLGALNVSDARCVDPVWTAYAPGHTQRQCMGGPDLAGRRPQVHVKGTQIRARGRPAFLKS